MAKYMVCAFTGTTNNYIYFISYIKGAPIIRPLWWVSPTDQDALAVGNQFLVGETLLVAPVLMPGTTEIDIYLPEGTWHDEINDKDWDGRQWLKSYKVELHQIATFTQARTIGI